MTDIKVNKAILLQELWISGEKRFENWSDEDYERNIPSLEECRRELEKPKDAIFKTEKGAIKFVTNVISGEEEATRGHVRSHLEQLYVFDFVGKTIDFDFSTDEPDFTEHDRHCTKGSGAKAYEKALKRTEIIAHEYYTHKEVVSQTGISERELIYFSEKRIIIPSVKDAAGRGSSRQYSPENIAEVRLAMLMRNNGFEVQTVKNIMDGLRLIFEDIKLRFKLEFPLSITDSKDYGPSFLNIRGDKCLWMTVTGLPTWGW